MSEKDLGFLQGTWKCLVSGSLGYGQLVGGELRFAYCFGGNDKLTGHYFNWRQAGGDSLVARFKWSNGVLTGYTRLKRVGEHRLEGGWWSSSEDGPELPFERQARPTKMVNSVWVRQTDGGSPPEWAQAFFDLPREP
jgi:hypothetical protein